MEEEHKCPCHGCYKKTISKPIEIVGNHKVFICEHCGNKFYSRLPLTEAELEAYGKRAASGSPKDLIPVL